MSWKLSGLASESETSSWRMAAEFEIEPDAGKQILAGAGYGSRWLTPLSPDIDPAALEQYRPQVAGAGFGSFGWEKLRRSRSGRSKRLGMADPGCRADAESCQGSRPSGCRDR